MQDKTDIQRKKIKQGNPTINLQDSCRIGNGIQQLTSAEKAHLIQLYQERKDALEICFFIPASGSGSRMFSDFYAYLSEPENLDLQKAAQNFMANIQNLAIFQKLSDDWKEKIRQNAVHPTEFLHYLLSEQGLNLGNLPKGMIPFHQYGDRVLNPFQEHLIQGSTIGNSSSQFHFTINKQFEDEIKASLRQVEQDYGVTYNFSFSEQDPDTHSIAFTPDLEPAANGSGKIITRPAGHGALIKNLNKIIADLVFIRNIDNMQHQEKATASNQTRQQLAGALLRFQDDIREILEKVTNNENFSEDVRSFNETYDMRIPDDLFGDREFVLNYFNRPLRVCGMVKNEGAPGGGPFWVKNNGYLTRQIIEKSQIDDHPEQIKLMETATHFNPVELVCSVRDYTGNKFDLSQFVDEHQYFIVHKTQEGKSIQYIEQPGLWNGAMAHWLTLFYEIDSACFSPVKTVMDLLKPAHQG
ncbi:MAG: DUF4301 family protein [Crocinitomicaceae bacterium]|nr:DUF4301 family protein [Crocinitomicaceae bacterium]